MHLLNYYVPRNLASAYVHKLSIVDILTNTWRESGSFGLFKCMRGLSSKSGLICWIFLEKFKLAIWSRPYVLCFSLLFRPIHPVRPLCLGSMCKVLAPLVWQKYPSSVLGKMIRVDYSLNLSTWRLRMSDATSTCSVHRDSCLLCDTRILQVSSHRKSPRYIICKMM